MYPLWFFIGLRAARSALLVSLGLIDGGTLPADPVHRGITQTGRNMYMQLPWDMHVMHVQ
jgi:hypothetical protein